MIETDKERLCYNCVHSSPDCSFCGKTKQNITPRSRCDPSHSKAFDLIDNACSFEEWKKKEKQKQNFANGKFEIDEEYSLQIIDHRIIELKRNKSVINRFEFDHLDIVLLNKISSVITDLNLVENRKEAKKLLRDVIFKHFNDYRVMLLSELGDIKKNVVNNELDERFYKPNLLESIWLELDKDHKLDHKEKLAVFIIALSGELNTPYDRCSTALKGDSSAGKDSIIKTILKHFPSEDSFLLTRGTTAALEDEAKSVKRIAFSEINKHREGGANSEITETFKQLAEGGTDVLKKDPKEGYKNTTRSKSEQKTMLYGTTETESDEELETRYVIVSIKGYAAKNKIVVDDALNKATNFNYHINYLKNDESWISKGIRLLDHDCYVIIPFAKLLQEKIIDGDKEVYFFDYTKERIKRDAKRLLSITKAITWIHQKQRTIIEKNNHKFIIAEPSDFITAVDIFADFFNLTYSGMDFRLQKCLEKLRGLEGKHDGEIMKLGFDSKYYNYVLRHKLQEDLGIASINTIKQRIEKLKDLGYIKDTHYQRDINPQAYLIKIMGVNEAINRVSLAVTLTALDTHLTAFLTPQNIEKVYKNKEIKNFMCEFLKGCVSNQEIDTHQIDTLNSSECTHTFSNDDLITFIQEKGSDGYNVITFIEKYGEYRLNNLIKNGDVVENPKDVLRVVK